MLISAESGPGVRSAFKRDNKRSEPWIPLNLNRVKFKACILQKAVSHRERHYLRKKSSGNNEYPRNDVAGQFFYRFQGTFRCRTRIPSFHYLYTPDSEEFRQEWPLWRRRVEVKSRILSYSSCKVTRDTLKVDSFAGSRQELGAIKMPRTGQVPDFYLCRMFQK